MPSLRALHRAGHRIDLVLTQPDRPGHRLRPTPPAVKPAAAKLGLEVFQPDRIGAQETVARLRAAAPDLVVVVAYGQIIPPSVLEMPARGVVNVHGSLLPRWRGAAPVAHAILAGDSRTGVTIMRMDEQLDHGPILATAATEIGAAEDAAGLTARLAVLGAGLLVETLADLDGRVARAQDHVAATRAPKLSRADGEADWGLPAVTIDRMVRAFTPWPGVTLPWSWGGGGERIKVLRGRLGGHHGGEPGSLLGSAGEGLEVATGEGSYVLLQVQVAGGRPVAARTLGGRA